MEPLKQLTLKDLLARSVSHYPDHVALSLVNGEGLTYSDLGKLAERIGTFLHARGIQPGDRVAILSESQPHWGAAYFGIASAGIIAVPILPDFRAQEIDNILSHSETRVIFVSRRLLPRLKELKYDGLEVVVLLNDLTVMDDDSPEADIQTASYSAMPEVQVKEDDTAAIIYTSGTTGQSKGVMLSHKNIVSDAIATTDVVPVSDQERVMSVLPLAHTYECTLGLVVPLMCGSAVYYLGKIPTASVLLPAMAKIRPTMILTVPLIIEKIYETRILPQLKKNALMRVLFAFPPTRRLLHRAAGNKLHKTFGGALHFFGIGGAAVSPQVELFLYDADFCYVLGYGLTETSPLISTLGKARKKYRSIGKPLPGMQIRIDDKNPKTGEGEICITGPNVMQGYYKNQDKTKEAFTKDGWFRTGDLGCFDKEGDLFIKGRIKNVILGPSGENIYPEEIEAVLNAYEYVMDSLVLRRKGQLVALVNLNQEYLKEKWADLQLSSAEMQTRCAELVQDLRKKANAQLNAFSRLGEVVEQLEPFEKTPTKKIKRYLYTG